MAADDEVSVKFGANTSEAESGVDKVGSKLKDLNPEIRELAEAFGGLRRTFIEAFAVDKIAEFIERIADLGENAIRSSEMLGIGVEKVQELGFAARMVGGSSEGMTIALERLEKNMADIGNPTSMAAKAFHALGISEQDIKDKSPEQVLGLIANKFHDAADGAGKTAIAIDLMGRSGAQMIPLLNQGSEGLEKMGIAAKDTGSVLNDVQAEGLEKTAQDITKLKASTEGAGIALLEVFKPGIDGIIEGLTSLLHAVTFVINEFRILAVVIEGEMVQAIALLSEAFDKLRIIAVERLEQIKTSFTTLGQIIDDVVHGHFDKAADDWVAGLTKIVQANVDASGSLAKITTYYDDLSKKIRTATDNVMNYTKAQQESGNKIQLTAPSTGTDKNNLIDAEMEAYQEKIRLLAQGLTQSKDIMDAEVDLHQLSKQQEIAQEKSYTDAVYEMMIDQLEREATIGGLTVQQVQKINDQILTLQGQLYTKELQLTAQAAKDQEAINKQQVEGYRSILDQIGGGFDSVAKGVLQGTQTFKQAFLKLYDDIGIMTVELIAKLTAEWAGFNIAKSLNMPNLAEAFGGAGTTLGKLTGAGSDATKNALLTANNAKLTTLEGSLTTLLAQLGVHTAVTTTNTAAVTTSTGATVTGTAATTTNTATQSTGMLATLENTLATAENTIATDLLKIAMFVTRLIPGFEEGTMNAPGGLSILHPGEIVLNPTASAAIRGGATLGSGASASAGGNFNITIQAIDTQTGMSFLKNNISTIASALNTATRNNNASLRTALMS